MPDALIVSAEPKHRHSKNHLAAIGAKRVFQRFDLRDSIDTSSVHATFENGLLKITAKLATPKVQYRGQPRLNEKGEIPCDLSCLLF